MGGSYLQDPAEAETGVHELHEPEQQLQCVDVPVEAVPQVDVLHLPSTGHREDGQVHPVLPTATLRCPRPAKRPPCTFTATAVPSCSRARCTWARLAAAIGW